MTVLLAIGIWISFNGASQQAQLVTDRLLTGSARVIAEDLYFADGKITAEIPPAALEMFASESRDRVVYRLIGPGDVLIAGYGDLPQPVGTSATPFAYDTEFRSEPVRAVAFPQEVATPAGLVSVTVLVAETVRARSQLFSSLLLGQVAQQIALVLVAAAFVWIGIGLEVRPLLALAGDVQRRRPEDFAPIPLETTQTELRPLLFALNSFMGRLERAIGRQREFLETAAHQLRTPLTVLKTQVSFALRSKATEDKDEALRAIDDDLNSMSRLASQLLVLGRLEHDPHSLALHPIDLSKIATEVASEMAPSALDAGIDLVVHAPHSTTISADDGLARELLVNLIENAIQYAGTGAVATISTASVDGSARLLVSDTGRGVSDDDRARVLQRFQRGRNAGGIGSGLGLSIVAELTEMFGGTLALSEPDGGGFAVELTFPVATTAA